MKLFKNVWFRCITTLLLIIVLSGSSIAVLSDVLYVSPEERTQRGITKVYGKLVDYETVYDVDSDVYTFENLTKTQQELVKQENGEITKIYTVGNDEVLFQSVGFDGFKNGTVTLWVRVKINGDKNSIEQVVLESNKAQSLIGNLKPTYYKNFELEDVTQAWKNGELFVTKGDGNLNPVAGATYSANAGNNAVNCVIKYVGEVYDLEKN